MKRIRLLLSLSLAIFSASSVGQENPAREKGDADFFRLLSLSSADQEPLTPEEMARQSEVIVLGFIDSIHEGRELYHEKDSPFMPPLKTAIVTVDVEDVLKGEAGTHIYFEYVVGGVPAEVLDQVKYEGEVLLYLRENVWSEEHYVIVGPPVHILGENDTLFSLTRDSAFFIGDFSDIDNMKVEQPLGPANRDAADPGVSSDRAESVGDLNRGDVYIPDNVKRNMERQSR